MDAAFEANWPNMKDLLLEGLDVSTDRDGSPNNSKRRSLDILLDNFYQIHLEQDRQEQESTNGSSRNIAVMSKIILPIMRRVFPALIANEIIGVQAIKNSSALIDTLRIKRNDNSTTIHQHRVEAVARQFSARWTFEAAQDGPTYDRHGKLVDVEAEIMAYLAQEIIAEKDQELLRQLRHLSGLSSLVYHTIHPHDGLVDLIKEQAASIGDRSRRGEANWCVVSPTVLMMLLSTHAFTKIVINPNWGELTGTATKLAGYLGNIKVYVDYYANYSTPILIGYKGQDETDAAGWYCPLQLIHSSKVEIDPNTFEPIVRFQTRYAYTNLRRTDEYSNDATDYLGLVTLR